MFWKNGLWFALWGVLLWVVIVFSGGYLVANVDTVYTVRFIFGTFFVIVVSLYLLALYREIKQIIDFIALKNKGNLSVKENSKVWGEFYKKVSTNGLALFSAIAVFLGAVLIVEQNRLLYKSNQNSTDNFKKSQTVDVMMMGTSESLINSRKLIFKYADDNVIIPKRPRKDEEHALRLILNYYERVSAQVNRDALDIDLIRNTIGGPMKRYFRVSEKYIRYRRCKSREDNRRKLYEQYEIFIECQLLDEGKETKVPKGPKEKRQKLKHCMERVTKKINKCEYCGISNVQTCTKISMQKSL